MTYNSHNILPGMLASLPHGADCTVIDNNSTDHAALLNVVRQYDARLIRNNKNVGFGTACNIGAAHTETEFFLFLNPDARLEAGALEALVIAADTHRDAVAFNPAISGTNGRPYFKRGSVLLPKREKLPSGWPETDCRVPVLSGAALFVRRTAFEAVGGFDPAIFLYHEDDDLALRLRTQCGPLMFVRAARVMHDAGNSTTRSSQLAAFKAFHMGQSRIYALRKHKRTGAERKALISAFWQRVSPVALISARKRAKQTAFLRGVLGAMQNKAGP
ncbi:glycosyltransferase family 2 protein [Roseovarius azorensis]|uniref:glycosyltransferase family 2 protein n=1 Tax=Roseovarius azorensis TaxID=1287727 RepID=UPI001FE7148B